MHFMLFEPVTKINSIEARYTLSLFVIVLSAPGANIPGAVGIQILRQPTI